MDTETLRTFVALSSYRNYTKTADALFVAQSTVTNRILELEKEVGHPLLARTKRSVTLTPEGELFLSYAKRIIEMEETSIRELNTMHKYQKTYRIGTTNTIYECHLVPHIQSYIQANPGHAVKVTIGHSQDLLMGIQDKLYDVVYTFLPLQKSGYDCVPFATDNLILVTSTAHDLYADGIRKEDLASSDYLFCNFALQEVGAFIRELFPPHFRFGFEIDNGTKLIPYLLQSEGISFLPESLVLPYLEAGTLRTIPLLNFAPPKIQSYMICKSTQSV